MVPSRRSVLLLAATAGLAVLATACGAAAGPAPAATGTPRATGGASATTAPARPGTDPAASRDLLAAARSGDAEAVRDAVRRGADPETRDEQRRTPLLLAATGDHVEAAEVLVAAGADPDALDQRHDTPWLVTGVTGSAAMARVLAKAGPDYTIVNRYGGTSLIPAGEHGHADYVREVTTNPAIRVDVDHVNDLGWTALLEAVVLGDGGPEHQETVRLLLAAGADRSIADTSGTTPLEHAVQKGQHEVARLLRG